MAQPAKGQEPSMEEILASIRRIIADEPGNISRNEPPHALHKQGARTDGARIENRFDQDARREVLPSEPRSYEGAPAEFPTEPRAADEDVGLGRTPILSQGSGSLASPSGVGSPQPATSEEEIEAMLAEFQAGARESSVTEPAADSLAFNEPLKAVESALEAELAASDEAVPPEDEQEIEAAEPHPPPLAQAGRGPHRYMPDPPRAPDHAGARQSGREPVDGGLISAATTAAVDSAFNALAQTVLVQNGRTLEDLVREMLRPMLKAWLDDNLPGLVERLVRAEIERVSRGR
jgi:uncharacterized protein